jgi:dTDP-4-dehydrorhamnose reductase
VFRLKIVLTGSSGQVGAHLLPLLQGHEVIAPQRNELNLMDAQAVRAYIEKKAPQLVINPAAYTAVDKAETEPDAAFAINARAPEAMARACKKIGAPLIHFSTDYVYDGSATQPWTERDAAKPISVYGASKLAGEQAIAASGGAHIILRTSWVYSKFGKNFLLTMQRLAAEKEFLRVVSDQYGTPNWAGSLARAVAHIVNTPAAKLEAFSGIYNLNSHGATSWHGFASAIVAAGPRQLPVHPISTADFPTPAKRPGYSVLDAGKFERTFGYAMPFWGDALAQCLREPAPKGR